jgi:gluconate 2-dehydrogenase gamma chain
MEFFTEVVRMVTRREFILTTAYGVLGAGIIEQALGQTVMALPKGGFAFFTPAEGEVVAAMTERIWPTTESSPGANEAGVVFYIDKSLSSFYRELKDMHREGIASLDSYTTKTFGKSFSHLSAQQQDEVLSKMEKNAEEVRPFFSNPSAPVFFALIVKETREGLFTDPVHGGNRNFIGWKSIKYPGPKYYYTAEMQATYAPINEAPYQSVGDL